jgi:hypothetical protein
MASAMPHKAIETNAGFSPCGAALLIPTPDRTEKDHARRDIAKPESKYPETTTLESARPAGSGDLERKPDSKQ